MILGFEKYTSDLSESDLEIARQWARAFNRQPNQVFSNSTIRMLYKQRTGNNIDGPRVRKIINYIRLAGLSTNLIATSKGYKISTDAEEVRQYIKSLTDRIDSISAVRQVMIDGLNQKVTTTDSSVQKRLDI